MAEWIWPQVALADLVEHGQISYGVVQPGSEHVAGVPIVRVKDLRNGAIQIAAPARVSEQIAERHARTVLHGGEVLVTLVGTVGEAAVVPPELAGWNVARAVAVLRPAGVAPEWLRLCFRTDSVIHQIAAAVNTTVQTTLNLSDLKRVRIPVPDAPVRRAIAEVLGALDDKIAANTHLAATLEDLAIAEAATVTSRIPLGAVVMQHKAPIDPVRIDVDRVAHFSLPAFDSGRIAEFVSPSEIKSQKFVVGQPSVLVSKLNPRFPRVWDVPELPGVPALASTEFLVLEPSRFTSTLLWALMAQPEFGAALESKVAGTSGSHQRVRPDDLLSTPIGNPRDVDAQVAALVTALGLRSHRARSESVALAATRDTLLPALMSGALRVRDAESVVEELT